MISADALRASSAPLVRDRSVLVAGAGGFIGGHLAGALRDLGAAYVRSVDQKPLAQWYQRHMAVDEQQLDLSVPNAAQVATRGIDVVVNLAADMGGIGFIEANKARCMLSVLINTNLLRSAVDAGVERYFYSSSACIYPAEAQRSADVVALREDDAYPAMPEDGYGWEKLFSERMCRHFREDFDLATRVARYHNVYGPFGAYEGGREKAPAAICRKVARAALTGDHEIEIWGDGEQTRSFMYVDDCVTGTLAIAAGEHVDPLNLGRQDLVTINQLVGIVEDIAGVRLERRYQAGAAQGVRGRNSDNEAIRAVLDWEPSITLRDGLERTYRWIHDEMIDAPRPAGAKV